MKVFLAAVIAICASVPVLANELVRVESAHDVSQTVDRLEEAVTKAGATVFARVDHAKGAENVGMELTPATLLIFGNPNLGTPAMQEEISMGVDLPMRVLTYQDDDGKIWLAYHDPANVAATHGVPTDHPVIGKMAGALAKLTETASVE
ncbi:MAG: DUF302 domain-containing protein [Geminicoccaceae bacterium]